MDKREYHQNKAEKLSKEHDNLILEWATGCGKSTGILRCIDADISGYEWYIVVPEILQVENIKAEIKKQGFQYLVDEGKIADIICYASFKNLEGFEGNLWFDEVQHLSKLKEDITKTIDYKRIFASSATIPDKVRERLTALGTFYTYKIPLSQAIEEGILPEPKVYIKYTYPDNTIKKKYTINKKTVYLTDNDRISYFDSQIDKWRNKKNEQEARGNDADWMENMIIRLGSNRKSFIASSKTKEVKELIANRLEGKRFICFTGSVKQCDEVGKDFSVNYKKGKKNNINTLEAFNNYEIDRLFTNRMGREGLNLEGIQAVVTTQLGSGRDGGLEFIQTAGRGFRSSSPELYILVAKGTRDEQFLSSALKHIDKKYIEYL